MAKTAVLFGGAGFIGSYLAVELLQQNIVEEIVLADLVDNKNFWPKQLHRLHEQGKIKVVISDVRKEVDQAKFPTDVKLIVNLAAVHREPGHEEHEYYDTNLPGAENVCAFAEKVNCNNIIFTSSIAVYGATESPAPKTELTEPTPNTPYGISKLKAEEIHRKWQQAGDNRQLMIVRPGVIFGFGEKGNVTRMLKAILGGYFAFTGNKQTRKAGGYVKELCRAIVWMYQQMQQNGEEVVLFNFTMNPPPAMEEYGQAIIKTSGRRRFIPSLPFGAILLGSYLLAPFNKIGINPKRVRKAARPNPILPEELEKRGYQFKYSLQQAMDDWRAENPDDWK